MSDDMGAGPGQEGLPEAMRLNDLGMARADAGDLDGALGFYRQAIDVIPAYSPVLYNMGLIYKRRRQWAECLDFNERAARRLRTDEGDPAWWNLGIAATALHRWDVAREAWRRYGVPIPDGEGELELDFGPAPVRLNPDGPAEVVWGTRIDPARVRIANVPTPESGHRWGDIVLNDGEPKGERRFEGRVYPVFDEIEIWLPSDVPTLSVEVTAADPDDSRALEEAFEQAGLAAEDWTKGLRTLCKACSEGTAPEGHEHPPAPYGAERRFGLAAPVEAARQLLADWAAARPGTREHGDPVPLTRD
jgi:tetratricopeptide (TPR) repeat protein